MKKVSVQAILNSGESLLVTLILISILFLSRVEDGVIGIIAYFIIAAWIGYSVNKLDFLFNMQSKQESNKEKN